MRAFREATQIMVKMWTEEMPAFVSEYFHIRGAINEPKGVRKPYPPLWIGGGEQVTLKLVAQYGNASNCAGSPDDFRKKAEILRGHCETVGRSYDAIIKSTNANIVFLRPGVDIEEATRQVRATYNWSFEEMQRNAMVGEPAPTVERLAAMKEAGANYFITYFPRIAYDHEPLQIFAEEVAPHLR